MNNRRLALQLLEDRHLLAGDTALISEFMASNENTIDDGYGKSPDWIEIRNPTDAPIDLAGWSLTDDPEDLDKWSFPPNANSVLEPFEYKIVFASDRDTVDPDGNFHTNFKISAGGEYIALVNTTLDVVSEFGSNGAEFPEQETDISYGIEGAALESNDILYVDATSGPTGNTRLTVAENGSTVFQPSGIDIGNQGSDGLWEQRTFANNGTIFEAGSDSAADNGQALTTSLDDLVAGSYEVFAYLWSDTNNNWDLRLGLEPNSLSSFRPTTPGVKSLASIAGADGLAASGFASPVLAVEGNRTMFEVSLGSRSITAGESIRVFVDDVPNVGGRSWYDGVGVRRSQVVIQSDSPAAYLVPQNGSLGTSWTEIDFDATANGFTDGTAAIGYENSPDSNTSYSDLFNTSIPRGTDSTYLRIPFEIEDVSAVTGMQLNLQSDDGFVAYLNGQRVADLFAPSQLDHRSLAADSRSDGDVLAGDTYSLSQWISQLQNGTNILAFHLLNASSTSSDYLLAPELLVSTASSESGLIRYFDTPTPGGPNGLGFLGFVADTKFSVDRGFYDEPFDVEITSKTDGASIYYSLDGSTPHPDSAASLLYDNPIRIERTTNLRAAAYKDTFRPTNVDTQTYIFLDNVLTQNPRRDANDPRSYPATWQGGFSGDYTIDSRVVEQWSDDNPDNTDTTLLEGLKSIPSISLTLDHEDLWDSSDGIYPNATQRGQSWRRPGSIEYFDPNSDAEFQYNVGIAMHGAASADNARLLKHSFRLRFSPQYDGPSKLEFPLFDNSDFADINQIILRAAFTDAFATRSVTDRYSPLDSTYMRDVWMRDAQLAAGGTAAQNTYAHLYINGLYWGLYNPAERSTDEQFFTGHFGGDEEDWDIMKDFNELSAGNRNSWDAMFRIARSITNSNADAKFFEIQGKDSNGEDDPNRTNYLNMDRFIDYMALHLFAGVEDWPHHNWHAGFNREDPGLGWQFHTWDQEIGLDQLVRDRTNASDSNSPAELYDELRRSPEFRLKFADRIQELFFNDGAFTEENNQERWMARANQIEGAIIGESARWGDAREGQTITAYRGNSPLPDGTGEIPRGSRRVPLMTVDHWRDSVTYVNDTFFTGADDIFLDRMRADNLFPDIAAPAFQIDGQPQHGGDIRPGGMLHMDGPGEIYFTTDGTDPRKPGGDVQGQLYTSAISLAGQTDVNARARVNGQWSPLLSSTFTPTGTPGDLNNDNLVDGQDIDALFAAVAANSNDSQFDLNGDDEVDDADSEYLIETIIGTRRGDANLDGKVDFADFLAMSANFGKTDEPTWEQGDFDGDGEISFADFLLLSANFGFDDE